MPTMLTFDEWLSGPGRGASSWDEARQRRAYGQYTAAQQKFAAGAADYAGQLSAYQGAFKTAKENQQKADKDAHANFIAVVSRDDRLRKLANDYAKPQQANKKVDRFPAGTDVAFVPKSPFPAELAKWSAVFGWLKGKDKKRYQQDLSWYHSVTDGVVATYRAMLITEVPAAVEKTRRLAPTIYKRIEKSVLARQPLEKEFYADTLAKQNAEDLRTGAGRLAATSGKAGDETATGTITSTDGLGGMSWTTILLIIIVVGLLGYGVYYLATQ